MQPTGPARSSLAFDWLMGILSALLSAGVIQDGWAHNHGKVDESFFTPWHAILYGTMALNGLVLGIVGLRNVFVQRYRFRDGLPYGYWLSLIGIFLFAIAGGLDLAWHTIFGIETDINALVSPTHLTLGLAAALVFSGPIRSIAHQHGLDAGGWAKVGPAVLGVAATLALVGFFTQYGQPMADDGIAAVMAKNDEARALGGLYVMNADGSNQRRLMPSTHDDLYGPSASPDGKFVVYRLVETGAPSGDLYVARLDGTAAHRITHSGRHDTQPAWSPDGKWIAYVSFPAKSSGNVELRVIKPDGSSDVAVYSGVTSVSMPSWSPDGKTIAVGSRNGSTDEIALFSRGTDQKPAWLAATQNGFAPAWSPDGTKILFSAGDSSGSASIAVTDPKGSHAAVVIQDASFPAWSSDGRHIAFVRGEHGIDQIFVADAAGGHQMNLSQLSGMDATRPAWARRGQIVFVATGRRLPDQSEYALALSLSGALIQSIVIAGAVLLIVRRWRSPVGAVTLILVSYATAMATQNDDYFAIPAALVAGIAGDVIVATLGDRARRGIPFYALGTVIPLLLFALYTVFLARERGLGWPPNMIFGAPIIAGFAGMLVAFAYDPPLRPAEPQSSASSNAP